MQMKENTITFQEWCVFYNRFDLLERWDYKLNNCNPDEVASKSNKKFYFKCPDGTHESNMYQMSVVTRKINRPCKCKQCNSFAQWGIDNICEDFLQKYWDYDKNININPWHISIDSNKKVWIKCQEKDYHGSYYIGTNSFKYGARCHYCSNKTGKKVHPKDSFAQYHIDNTDKDFLEKYWSDKNIIDPFTLSPLSTIKIWIKCQKTNYHKDYETSPNMFTKNHRCPYCSHRKIHEFDSLAYSHPNIFLIWSDKNKKSPYEYMPKTHQKIWLKCQNGHNDYFTSLSDATRYNFRCPTCVIEREESMLQEKVRKYLTEHYKYKVLHESKCTIIPKNPKNKHNMPFDNEIVELKILIETMGQQHTVINGWNTYAAKTNNTTPEYELHKRKLYDRYKRLVAHINKYFYLEIPYFSEQDESYKKLIDDKIAEILAKQESEVA